MVRFSVKSSFLENEGMQRAFWFFGGGNDGRLALLMRQRLPELQPDEVAPSKLTC